MVSVLASSAVDHGFESRSGQTKDYQIGMCCFTANHAALRRKSKDWLARNQGNVSEWSDMSCVELGASPLSHAALRRKSKDWVALNQNNVSEWSGMFIHGLLFQ
jgi:hypothetical protein